MHYAEGGTLGTAFYFSNYQPLALDNAQRGLHQICLSGASYSNL